MIYGSCTSTGKRTHRSEDDMSDWICNKCDIGVLDRKKRVQASNKLEFCVICPECGCENPEFSFTSDPDSGWSRGPITLVVGGVPSDSDVEPFMSGISGPFPPGVKMT